VDYSSFFLGNIIIHRYVCEAAFSYNIGGYFAETATTTTTTTSKVTTATTILVSWQHRQAEAEEKLKWKTQKKEATQKKKPSELEK
jgi:hypothetical protein